MASQPSSIRAGNPPSANASEGLPPLGSSEAPIPCDSNCTDPEWCADHGCEVRAAAGLGFLEGRGMRA